MAFGSLLTGVSALQADQQMLDVIGNNLANSNTPGFKEQRPRFADLFYQTLVPPTPSTAVAGGTDPIQLGYGARMSSIDTIQSQGTLQPTGRDYDVGIQGDGFFQLSDGTRTFYSRAGSFDVDSSGFLRDPADGFNVLRFGSVGEPSATSQGFQIPGDDRIRIPLGAGSPGQPTANITLSGNLSADAAVGTTVPSAIQVYDDQGSAHTLSLTFTKTAANTWDLSASIPAADGTLGPVASGGTASNTADLGTVTFDNNGAPVGSSAGPVTLTMTANFTGITATQTIKLSVGTAGAFDGLTQFGGSPSAAAVSQDGFGSGTLTTVNIGKDGVINGVFSNGKVVPLAQLAVASFTNPSGLQREGNNLFSVTSQSGQPLIGAGLTAGRGSVQQGVVEQSNVDVATEFTQLIIAQRGFEVNAKTITVSDQVLQALSNIIQ
jgi:flagellar hook protein FlgE